MRKQYDFSGGKRAKDVPHLAKLQTEAGAKTRITIMLDNDVIAAFREAASKKGMGYQTLINQVLRQSFSEQPLTEESLRRVLREEMGRYELP